ncbi:carnitine O-palmitoyltransferase 2, mitochondrial [Pieris rapae]|uniref:carnitine O-palmitoyltransferase 2, mitochondrial n=1 Tax=Pieris rapae TaxID=64459 RepID=UPI000B926EA0|nr:carnitine O-palmitoyltransferase 2, mitochondrial [Pieris rapae]
MLRLCKFSNSEKTIIKFIKENYSSSANSRYVRDKTYQFLQHSKVPTMHFQKSMPRLPIPDLSKTGERYLKALKPLLSSTQYADAEKRTNNFILKEGKELQAKLITKDKVNKHTSYISDYWFDLYLRDRVPLPINYNPLLVFQNDSRPAYNDQLVRATNFLVTASRFMLSLRASILEPEVFHMQPKKSDTQLFRTVTGLLPSSLSWYGAYLFKAFPLDMSQFPGLFNATRIPQIDKDRIFRDPSSKHVVVQRKGNFYVFDVLDSNGNLLLPEELLGNMAKIISDDKPSADFPLGILTSQDRNAWAKQRQHLEEIGNAEALKKIDSAIFNLVLDEDSIHEDKHKILRQYLHSDGNNRWFDKSFSLIVTKDGVSGINFEHSWGDGVGVLRFFQDTYKEITNNPFIHPESTPSDNHITVEKLSFKIDDKIKECVRNAQMEYKKWCDSLSIDYILYEDLNREDCKKFKVSADCIMQIGFQAAYHLLYGKYVGTYESCSTSAFKHGRTETMRPCTEKTKAFCDQLHSNNYSKDSLRTLMTECSSYHSELVKEAAMGQGFDRHLFALRKMAEENNIQTEIYDSFEYKYLNKSILSTSTLSSPNVLAGGFGPVTREGFGIGYSAFADKLGAAVTSYKDHNDSTQFVEALHKSFVDITKILSS